MGLIWWFVCGCSGVNGQAKDKWRRPAARYGLGTAIDLKNNLMRTFLCVVVVGRRWGGARIRVWSEVKAGRL